LAAAAAAAETECLSLMEVVVLYVGACFQGESRRSFSHHH